jgi:glucose dehydrogenase
MIKYLVTIVMAITFSFSSFADNVTSWKDIVNAKKTPENWLTHHGTLDGHRFSGLKKINKKNVKT